MLGRAGDDFPIFYGTGSGKVNYEYVVTPYAGIKSRASNVDVQYKDGIIILDAVELAKVNFYPS